jgi:hypothetical protein
MLVFFAITATFSLQIALCLFGYFAKANKV